MKNVIVSGDGYQIVENRNKNETHFFNIEVDGVDVLKTWSLDIAKAVTAKPDLIEVMIKALNES